MFELKEDKDEDDEKGLRGGLGFILPPAEDGDFFLVPCDFLGGDESLLAELDLAWGVFGFFGRAIFSCGFNICFASFFGVTFTVN